MNPDDPKNEAEPHTLEIDTAGFAFLNITEVQRTLSGQYKFNSCYSSSDEILRVDLPEDADPEVVRSTVRTLFQALSF